MYRRWKSGGGKGKHPAAAVIDVSSVYAQSNHNTHRKIWVMHWCGSVLCPARGASHCFVDGHAGLLTTTTPMAVVCTSSRSCSHCCSVSAFDADVQINERQLMYIRLYVFLVFLQAGFAIQHHLQHPIHPKAPQTMRLFDPQVTQDAHTDNIWAACWCAVPGHAEQLVTGSVDETVKTWIEEDNALKNIHTLPEQTLGVVSTTAHSGGQWCASSALDSSIRVWSTQDEQPQCKVIEAPPSELWAIAFTPGSDPPQLAAAGGTSNNVALYNVNESEPGKTPTKLAIPSAKVCVGWVYCWQGISRSGCAAHHVQTPSAHNIWESTAAAAQKHHN